MLTEFSNATNETFAKWLLAERARIGISQDKLAGLVTAAGFPINQQYLTKVETGQRQNVPLAFAVAVTAALGTTPDVALGLAVDDPNARRLIQCPACKGTPPEGFTCNTCGGAS